MESEDIREWVEKELEEAELMIQEGSCDGEDYWRGRTDVLLELKRKLNA